MTPASSSHPLPVTQHTGREWLNAETVESCKGILCRPARSSADVCQRDAVRQRMGGGNTPSGVSPHPQRARLALRLVRQGDGLHYPVGQPLFGDSLPFLLTSVADKELPHPRWKSVRTNTCLPNSSGRNCHKDGCTTHSSRQLMCQRSRDLSRAPRLPARCM